MASLCRAAKFRRVWRSASSIIRRRKASPITCGMKWIKDRWVPMDPTLGLGGIGADHIKLGDSNLSGGSPLADLLGYPGLRPARAGRFLEAQ